MNRYLRTFWGTCFVPINDSFYLARGERIVKISTTFLPSCNACVGAQVAPISGISFGAAIVNCGYIVMPISGVNECGIVSTANTDNLVQFVLDFSAQACNNEINNCDVAYQLVFEIESDNILCCNIDHVLIAPWEGGQPNFVFWTCTGCSGLVNIVVHNLTQATYTEVAACAPNGLPGILCSDQEFEMPWIDSFVLGDLVEVIVCCCDEGGCCGTSSKVLIIGE